MGNRRDAFKVTPSGSIIVPTGSAAPTWTGKEGEMIPVATGGNFYLYCYIGGTWKRTQFT